MYLLLNNDWNITKNKDKVYASTSTSGPIWTKIPVDNSEYFMITLYSRVTFASYGVACLKVIKDGQNALIVKFINRVGIESTLTPDSNGIYSVAEYYNLKYDNGLYFGRATADTINRGFWLYIQYMW